MISFAIFLYGKLIILFLLLCILLYFVINIEYEKVVVLYQ